MTNHIAFTYNTLYTYVIQAPFTHIRFHRETLLFCSVSAYGLHVNEQNTPGKRCLENAFQSGSFQKRDANIV